MTTCRSDVEAREKAADGREDLRAINYNGKGFTPAKGAGNAQEIEDTDGTWKPT